MSPMGDISKEQFTHRREVVRPRPLQNSVKADGKGKQKSADLKAEPIETRQELAKAAGVSHDTIAKGKVIQAKASEETKARFLPPGVPVAAFEWAGWCPDMGVFWT